MIRNVLSVVGTFCVIVWLTGCAYSDYAARKSDPVGYAGNECAEMGYERESGEWKQCVFRVLDAI